MSEVHAWAAAQAPAHNSPGASEAMEAVAAAGSSYEGTYANMVVAGGKANLATAETNHTAYYNAYKASPTSEDSVDKLYNAPITAMTRISDMARISADWNPVLLGKSPANAQAYQVFLKKVVSMPLLTLRYATTEAYSKETSTWAEAINAIAGLFEGIAKEDTDAIVSGLTNLANAASTQEKVTETTSVFVQNALNVGNDAYSIYLYNTSFSFYHDKGKGFDTKQTTMDVVKVKLDWQSALWSKENAKVLVGQTSSSIANWGKDNGAPAQPNKIPALGGS